MSYDLKLENGDIQLDKEGDFNVVSNVNKAKQDAIKILVTPQGSNVFHKFFGSLLNQRIIGQVQSDSEFISILTASVQEAISTVIKLQNEQAKSQLVTPAERIIGYKNIEVNRSKDDPRQITASIYLQVADGSVFSESITVRLA